MPFEDVVITGYGTAAQHTPLADGEEKKSTVKLINEAVRNALEAAQLERRQIDCLFTHRPPAGESFMLFGQKILQELKIVPRATTAIMNHGGGMLSTLMYGALFIEKGLAEYVLCASGDGAAVWVEDQLATNANTEADAHFEAPYYPITPSLMAQFGSRYVHEYGVTEEDLAQVSVELRDIAIDHPESTMGPRGPIKIEDVIESPMIASPSRRLHCAPWYLGSRAGAVILSRRESAPASSEPKVHVRAVGEAVTHEHISGRFDLYGLWPWADGLDVTVTGAYVAAQRAFEYAGFGIEDVDVIETPIPFAFLYLMLLEDLGVCERGGAAQWVADGGFKKGFKPGSPAYCTNGGSLSFGQSALNCVMDSLLEGVQQLEGNALGRQVESAKRALIHSHGGALAGNFVALLERC